MKKKLSNYYVKYFSPFFPFWKDCNWWVAMIMIIILKSFELILNIKTFLMIYNF